MKILVERVGNQMNHEGYSSSCTDAVDQTYYSCCSNNDEESGEGLSSPLSYLESPESTGSLRHSSLPAFIQSQVSSFRSLSNESKIRIFNVTKNSFSSSDMLIIRRKKRITDADYGFVSKAMLSWKPGTGFSQSSYLEHIQLIKSSFEKSTNASSKTLPENIDSETIYLVVSILVALKLDVIIDFTVSLCSQIVEALPNFSSYPLLRAILSIENDPLVGKLRAQRENAKDIDYSIQYINSNNDAEQQTPFLRETFDNSVDIAPIADDESLWGHFEDIDTGSVSSLREFVSWNPGCFADDSMYDADFVETLIEEDQKVKLEVTKIIHRKSANIDQVRNDLETFFGLS